MLSVRTLFHLKVNQKELVYFTQTERQFGDFSKLTFCLEELNNNSFSSKKFDSLNDCVPAFKNIFKGEFLNEKSFSVKVDKMQLFVEERMKYDSSYLTCDDTYGIHNNSFLEIFDFQSEARINFFMKKSENKNELKAYICSDRIFGYFALNDFNVLFDFIHHIFNPNFVYNVEKEIFRRLF